MIPIMNLRFVKDSPEYQVIAALNPVGAPAGYVAIRDDKEPYKLFIDNWDEFVEHIQKNGAVSLDRANKEGHGWILIGTVISRRGCNMTKLEDWDAEMLKFEEAVLSFKPLHQEGL